MEQKEGKCGQATIKYDIRCIYSCVCDYRGCKWSVECPGGEGGNTKTEGTSPPREDDSGDDSRDWFAVAGDIRAVADALEERWKHRIKVPESMEGKELRRQTVTGTPEEMADALGLRLGERLEG